MQKNKTSTHTATSTIRPITISSNFKLDKVEKLTQIVSQIAENEKQRSNIDQQRNNISTQPREQKGCMSQKVLQVLKQRIKTSYDNLYHNYPQNKQKILKQIQTVQTNITGENTVNTKYQQVIKQKAKYDKLKSKVQQKQRKLKKLMDLSNQLKQQTFSQRQNQELVNEYQNRFSKYQQKKEEIQHNNLIYQQMLRQRKNIYLNLRERYNYLTSQINSKKQKSQRLADQNTKRRLTISKIIQNIQKEQQVIIPPKLAQLLSNKIQLYQNKHSYQQIIQHEAQLQQQRFQKIKQDTMKRRQQQRQNKLKKENQQKNKLQELHNFYLIKHLEQQKIKKLCAADTIQEVINCDIHADQQNLDRLNFQIQNQIEMYQSQNYKIAKQLQELISQDSISPSNAVTAQYLQQKIQNQMKNKRLLQIQFQKKQTLANQWLTIMHLINNNQITPQALKELSSNFMTLQRNKLSKSSKLQQKHLINTDKNNNPSQQQLY